LNTSSGEIYQRQEKNLTRWRETAVRLNWIMTAVVFAVEVGMYFVLNKSGMVRAEVIDYVHYYIIYPTAKNILLALLGHLLMKHARKDYLMNAGPIIALTFMCGNVAFVHRFFIVTMAIFCIPIIEASIFQSKRLLQTTTVLSIFLICGVAIDAAILRPRAWIDGTYLPTWIISVAICVVAYTISVNLINALNEQMESLLSLAEEAKASELKAIEANKAKSDFLSFVSHEIRTPLNAIVGMSDLMLQDDLSEKQDKYLKNIKVSGNSLVSIVNDILDQEKIEAGKMDIVEDFYQLPSLLDNLQLIIENRIGEKPVRLSFEIDENIPDCLVGDELRIRQVLINLLNNAVKYTKEGNVTLAINVEERNNEKIRLRFSVVDTGSGIKEEDIKNLFVAFEQADKKKNHKIEGTGLGLTIANKFVELMGGKIKVQSVVGKGSEFSFAITQGIGEFVEEVSEEVNFRADEANILVVDDTKINLMLFENMLGMVGITPDTAKSGQTALQMIQNKHYDLVYLDYMMPEMDGVETIKQLRDLEVLARGLGNKDEANYYKELKVVVLSADVSDATKVKFKKYGVSDYLEKPVELPVVKKSLLSLLPEALIEMDEA